MQLLTEADSVLRDIEELSGRNYLPIIGQAKGNRLATTVKDYGVRNVLEVGTLVGYSAILIAENLESEGKVFTIEINPKMARAARENIHKAGFASLVHVLTGDAIAVIPTVDEELDMVFLDAAKEEYLLYLKLAEEKLRPGGVVFADNVKLSSYAMRDYLDYVQNSGRYSSVNIDTGFDGIERSIKLF